MQAPVVGNFQGRISIAYLLLAFTYHYLSAPALLLIAADEADFGSDDDRADVTSNPILPCLTTNHATVAADPDPPVLSRLTESLA